MRNWINLFEDENLPAKLEPAKPMKMTFQGAIKENMTPYEAKAYLDMFPDGMLHHDIFENAAFVTVTEHGNYVFFDPYQKAKPLTTWDWEYDLHELINDESYDILTGWWYEPAQEYVEQLSFLSQEDWDGIRNESIPAVNTTPVVSPKLEN